MERKTQINDILQKVVTMLLVFVMTFYFLPMNIFAYTIRQFTQSNIQEENSSQDVISTNDIGETQEQEKNDYKSKQILFEDIQKRKANEKHYILEDGTQVVAMYPSNIHYKENGIFVDVDNTLVGKVDIKETLKLTEEELTEEEKRVQENEMSNENKVADAQLNIQKNQPNGEKILEDEKVIQEEQNELNSQIMENKEQETIDKRTDEETTIYVNKKNSYKTKFTNKTKGFILGSLTNDDETISWRLKNAKQANIRITNPEENKPIEEGTTIEDIQINEVNSSIEYEDILENTNINYLLSPESVKENIVLENSEAIKNKLVFEYETNGLNMKLLENKNIIVYKGNEEDIKFIIQAPFMYDSNLDFTDNIDIKLKKKKDKYELTITPDKKWLKAKERKYPVTIDPTIQTSHYVEDINDVFIYKGDTNNTTRWQAHILRVGNGFGNSLRSLIKFNLPKLESGDQVIAAELSICNYPDSNEWDPPTKERIIDLHRMKSNWDTKTANWSNASTKHDSKIIDYIRYKYDSDDPGKDNRFDITALVKDWYTVGKNYGVMLKEHTENTSETGTDMYFFSANIHTVYEGYRPRIIIAYRNQTGLEEYLSYHTQSAGRAGKIYTNDYNGNLTLVHTDVSTPGNRMPVTIEHIYNTNDKDIQIGFGKGMRLNLSQTLETITISSKEYLKYKDEDGTSHYLLKKPETNEYEDEDGLGITVKKSGTSMVMKDKAGNTMTFKKHDTENKWHLSSIKDTENNTCTLTYVIHGSNFLIKEIVDGAGDKISLLYNYGKLKRITDAAGRVTTYEYDDKDRLTTITYPDDKKSTYEYGSKNEITKVKNIDGSYMAYGYHPGTVYRIRAIVEYGTDSTKGNALTVTYGQNLTNSKSNRGYSNTYAFDNYGHATSIADFGKEDKKIDNAYGKAYEYGTSGGKNNKLTLESKLVSVKELPNNLIKNPTFENGMTNWKKRTVLYFVGNCSKH